jgi:hypothetical protein
LNTEDHTHPRNALIGISGHARSGKDTLYRSALASRGYERIALADPLKAMVLALELPKMATVPEVVKSFADNYYNYFSGEKSTSARERLQLFGTEYVRDNMDSGYWVYIALKEAKKVILAGGKVAITDVRFVNEANAIRGDKQAMVKHYRDARRAGAPVDAEIMDQLTSDWDEGGLLPPAGVGIVIRIQHLDRAEFNHASELQIDSIPATHVIIRENKERMAATIAQILGGLDKPLPAAYNGK